MSLRDLLTEAHEWADLHFFESQACQELFWRSSCLLMHSRQRWPLTDHWFRQSYTGRFAFDGGRTRTEASLQELALDAGLPEDLRLAIDAVYNEEY